MSVQTGEDYPIVTFADDTRLTGLIYKHDDKRLIARFYSGMIFIVECTENERNKCLFQETHGSVMKYFLKNK